ncbi:hypothetical protein [Dyadobacter sp. CY326]|uniref:hypothetical protein n=1 Tax=Dyadobacter sp. CY326 TaxID=2907300 RepID=UPI001F464744|nr:hypothetical protein [Dyadobacter sp. CY326]MCE7065483.1 hypothetical protein [Dyadobacter sp. CY326]
MKKTVSVIFANVAIAMGALCISCNSKTDTDRKKLANAEEKALETADEASQKIASNSDTTEIADVKEDLLQVNNDLNEKQRAYLKSLKEEEAKLKERVTELDDKIQTADGDAKKRLMSKKNKVTQERGLLQANILEMAKPMEDKRLETAQKEIQQRIVAINKELSSE